MIVMEHQTTHRPAYHESKFPPTIESMGDKKTKSTNLIATPPVSPPTSYPACAEDVSLLYPPAQFSEIVHNVRALTAQQLSLAMLKAASKPLPESDSVFPWLHGIHPLNYSQKCFFARSRSGLQAPVTYRGITLIRCPHETSTTPGGRLVGSLHPWQILEPSVESTSFRVVDEISGIGLRNFHLQAAKIATLSDIVVYHPICAGDESQSALALAQRLAEAQHKYRTANHDRIPEYDTFLVTDKFEVFEEKFPNLVAQSQDGTISAHDKEFLEQEQEYMQAFTKATEISTNVYMGNSQDWIDDSTYQDDGVAPEQFSVHIACKDDVAVSIPQPGKSKNTNSRHLFETVFPSSAGLTNDPTYTLQNVVEFCDWIYRQSHAIEESEFDWSRANLHDPTVSMPDNYLEYMSASARPSTVDVTYEVTPRKVLLTCKDGYTETSFLGLAYLMYAECMTIDEAWVYLHRNKKRDFYAIGADVVALQSLERILIMASPHSAEKRAKKLEHTPAPWFASEHEPRFRGSLPSRILDHLYLGNIEHANNSSMLDAIGITRVLSVGERPKWLTSREAEQVAGIPLASMYLQNIRDDGIDAISPHIEKCLDFIAAGYQLGEKTLVHCQVGVSRSASICIAEVVRRLALPLEQAYLLTRARRLNVIIQPNLKFMYELLMWSQTEHTRQKCEAISSEELLPRSIEWPNLASKISRLNRLYLRS